MHAQVPPDRKVLRINMDETSVKLYQDAGKGMLVARACRLRRTPRSLVQNVSRKKLRSAMTHAALLCDDPEAQRALPQLLIAGEASMTAEQEQLVRSVLPEHIVLLRIKKGWMNADVMCWLAQQVQLSLRAWESTHAVIFMVDAYKAHFGSRVLQAFARRNIMFHLIPAKVTWIMQPCDTHLFSQYKAHLAKSCQEKMLARSEPSLSWTTLAEGLVDTIEQIMHGRHWASAFAQDGLNGDQHSVSQRVWQKIGLAEPTMAGNTLPSLQQLSFIFPRNSVFAVGDLFAYFTRPLVSLPPQAEVGESEEAVMLDTEPANPWHGRLRSSSAQHLRAEDLVGSPPLAPPACPPQPMEMEARPPRWVPFLASAKRISRLPPRAAMPLQQAPLQLQGHSSARSSLE